MPRRDDLDALLRAHRPADATEAGHLVSVRALLAGPGDPFSRHRYDPGHLTASAFVISPDGGSVLLVLHGKLGRWLQPGGHIEPGDRDLRAAALREVAEEVGVHDPHVMPGLLDVDVHQIPRGREPAHEHHDVRFLLRARDLHFRAASDAKAARWVRLDQVSLVESDASVMRAVRRIARV